jgi:hypothetical protein
MYQTQRRRRTSIATCSASSANLRTAVEAKTDPCYMGVTRDGIWLHLSSFSGDGVSGGVVNLLVEGVDALHSELVAKGVRIDTGPVDQTWGTREMYVKDADGNCVRFIGSKNSAP